MTDRNTNDMNINDMNVKNVNANEAVMTVPDASSSVRKPMSKRTAWGYFIACILLEQIGIVFMNASDGLTNPLPSILCMITFGLSYALFGKCLKVINLAVGFAVWSGVAVIFTAFLSVAVNHHPLNTFDIIGLALVIIGIVGMNLKA